MDVVSQVFPVKVDNFVIEHLIHWDDVPNDPMSRLTFPRREMLSTEAYAAVADALARKADIGGMRALVGDIRLSLNPHPAGQTERNVPTLDGVPLRGIQHKYRETLLFFPSQGQTCHAYCSFCFRWPQFVEPGFNRFASRETEQLVAYLRAHPEVTDVLFTSGDPLIMLARNLAAYIRPVLEVPSASASAPRR